MPEDSFNKNLFFDDMSSEFLVYQNNYPLKQFINMF